MPKALVITANRKNDLELAAELRDIREALGEHSNFTIIHRSEFRFGDLTKLLLDEKPDILHFSGHGLGTSEATIALVGENGYEMNLTRNDLSGILSHLVRKPRLVILNACFSNSLAEEIKRQVEAVIGAEGKIRDEVARLFARAFYGSLGHSCSVKAAFMLAQVELKMAGQDPCQVSLAHLPENDPDKVVFYSRPELMASFVLNRAGKPEVDEDHYDIHLWLRGVDQNVESVSFQINHDSYECVDRYWEVNRHESASFLTDDFRTSGDVSLRATAWSRDWGTGTQSMLSDALVRNYGIDPEPAIAKALKVIRES